MPYSTTRDSVISQTIQIINNMQQYCLFFFHTVAQGGNGVPRICYTFCQARPIWLALQISPKGRWELTDESCHCKRPFTAKKKDLGVSLLACMCVCSLYCIPDYIPQGIGLLGDASNRNRSKQQRASVSRITLMKARAKTSVYLILTKFQLLCGVGLPRS